MTVEQFICESTILPLSLYFEPEEIAVACIGLATHSFMASYSSFKVAHFCEEIKRINGSKQDMNGAYLMKTYFKQIKLPELKIDEN